MPLTPSKVFEKTNKPRQETYGQTERRTDRPYFIASFRLWPGVQKSRAESNVAYSKDFTFYKYHNTK